MTPSVAAGQDGTAPPTPDRTPMLAAIAAALSELPDRQRAVVRLRLEGRSPTSAPKSAPCRLRP